ncbi:serine/threonine protein kinase, partial [Actinospica durhamensis]
MGRVYLGLAPTGYTAVKRVLPFLAADQNFLRHFSQELDNQARLPAGVSARLLAADRTARPPWFATEYIPGVTLHESVHVEGGSLPGPALWALLRELAERLHVVHGLSMMHRDLKPSNVMLTHSGVTLIDFGVARAADQSAVTATGVAVGTPAFMAPEQAKAERTLTPAVDVFSLGGVMAFAAGGRPPFGEGSGHDVFYRIVHQEPDLSAVEAVDPALAALVGACLAKDPAERPSAAELAGFAAANALPGPVAWPRVTAERIAARRRFAAAAPVADFDGTELESSWIGEVGKLPTPGAGPAGELAADLALDPEAAAAEAETAPLPPKGPDSAELFIPGPRPCTDPGSGSGSSPDSGTHPGRTGDHPVRRSRKTLMLLLPLLLVLGGTAGTLAAMGKVPFIWSDGAHGPDSPIVTGSASATGATGTATAGAPTPRTSAKTSTSAKPPASPTAKKSSGSGSSTGGSGTGATSGSGSGSGSGGSTGSTGGGTTTTKTTAPAATKTTAPSGPGGGEGYVSGSAVSADDCEGWLDYSNSYFITTVSAGDPASCEESVTQSSSVTPGPTTSTFTASNGKKNTYSPCSNCYFFGYWTLSEKICVWNTDDSADEKCSATFTYDSSTGKVT